MSSDDPFRWCLDEVSQFRGRAWLRGWAHHRDIDVTAVRVRLPDAWERAVEQWPLPTPDVGERHGEDAAKCGFAFEAALPEGRHVDELEVVVELADGSRKELADVYGPAIDADAYHLLERRFWARLSGLTGGSVLELGSRDRSGTVRRKRAGEGVRYVGLDILPGPNVDVVGDVHRLGKLFPKESFDAVFAISVFEHVLMPWKAVLEINKVLKRGGVVLVASHQSYPLHEIPWDYWRYSNDGWRALFNPATGFAILDVAMGEPAAVVPLLTHPVTRPTETAQAYLAAGVVAQKIGRSRLRWDVDPADVVENVYPA